MVCRCACEFGIIINLIFVTLTFELGHFWVLNIIKVQCSAYLGQLLLFHGFVMVYRCVRHYHNLILSLIYVPAIFNGGGGGGGGAYSITAVHPSVPYVTLLVSVRYLLKGLVY